MKKSEKTQFLASPARGLERPASRIPRTTIIPLRSRLPLDLPAMAVATAVAMTAASCLLSGVMGRIEGSSAFSSSGIAVFPLPPRSMLRGVGGPDMLQRKYARKAGRRGALDHRSRRRAVYCATICTPCRRNTHSRGEHGAAAQGGGLARERIRWQLCGGVGYCGQPNLPAAKGQRACGK